MVIKTDATVLSEFKCPTYPDLVAVTYQVCLGRQITRTPGGGYLYQECAEDCDAGKEILARFKEYKPIKKQKPNWNTTGCPANVKRKKVSRAVIDCVKCKQLVKAQIEYAIQMICNGSDAKAIKRLELVLEEI